MQEEKKGPRFDQSDTRLILRELVLTQRNALGMMYDGKKESVSWMLAGVHIAAQVQHPDDLILGALMLITGVHLHIALHAQESAQETAEKIMQIFQSKELLESSQRVLDGLNRQHALVEKLLETR